MAVEAPIIHKDLQSGLLPPVLAEKGHHERMTADDEALLAPVMRGAWADLTEKVFRMRSEVVSFEDSVGYGHYSPLVPEVVWTPKGEGMRNSFATEGGVMLIAARTHTLEEAFVVRAVVDSSRAEGVVLAVGDLPLQKNERERRSAREAALEIPLLRWSVNAYCGGKLRGIVLVDAHCGVTALEFLRRGVPAADLTAAPGMIEAAKRAGLLDGELCNIVVDTGAMARGRFVHDYLGLDCGVQAEKNSNGTTKSLYPINEWQLVSGRIAVFLDDRLMTFGTGADPIRKVMDNGATSAVFMVTYPEFNGPALQRFRDLNANYEGRVHVVTTDMHFPVEVDISGEPNIHVVPMQDQLIQVLGLVQQGVDIMNIHSREPLHQYGFDIAPWMSYQLGDI